LKDLNILCVTCVENLLIRVRDLATRVGTVLPRHSVMPSVKLLLYYSVMLAVKSLLYFISVAVTAEQPLLPVYF